MSSTSPTKKKKSLLSKILKITGITFLLLLVTLFALPFIFKGKLIQLAKDEANKKLNAKVDFGEFDLSIFKSFPDMRFDIKNVSVVGTKEFEGDSLLALKELSLDLDLLTVIKGENYKVNAIKLQNPRVRAKVLSDGKANWDIVKESGDSKSDTASSEPSKFKLKLSSLEITDAYIIYDDEKSGTFANIEDLDYTLSGDFTDELLQSKNTLNIEKLNVKSGGVKYLSDVKLKAKADVDMDLAQSKYTFKENELFLNELGLAWDGSVKLGDKDTDLDLKFKALKADFKTILSLIPAVYKKDFESLKAGGTVALDGFAKGIYNEKQYPSFGLNLKVENGNFKYPSLPKSVEQVFIDLKINNPNGNLDATVINLSKLSMNMGGNPITMKALVKTPITDPDFDFAANGTVNLSSIKEFIPLEKGDDLNGIIKANLGLKGRLSFIENKLYSLLTAYGTLETDNMKLKSDALPFEVYLNTLKLVFTNQYVELASLNARMGKSDIKASGRIDNLIEYIFKDDLLKGNFTVNSNVMDINELTSSDKKTTNKPNSNASSTPTENAAIDIPGNLDFELNTDLKRVYYDNLILDNVSGKVVMRNKKVNLENLKMNTLGGQIRVSGSYDSKNLKNPDIDFNGNVENFDIATTYKTFNNMAKLAPIAQYASGFFTVSLENFKAKLNDKMEPDLNTIQANGILKTKSVKVGGYPPFAKLGEVLKINELKNMAFQNLNFSYKIKDGRVSVSPFDVNIDKVKTTIFGSSGLDQSIDYTWKMQIPRSLFGANANSTINGLIHQANSAVGTNFTPGETIFVDVIFDGTATKPTVKTSLKEGLKDLGKEIKEQVIEVVKEKASEVADKILEEARKEAAKIRAEAQALSEKVRKEGYDAADKALNEVKNPFAKLAAQETAKIAKKEADKKAQKILDDANAKAEKVLKDAQAKSDSELKK